MAIWYIASIALLLVTIGGLALWSRRIHKGFRLLRNRMLELEARLERVLELVRHEVRALKAEVAELRAEADANRARVDALMGGTPVSELTDEVPPLQFSESDQDAGERFRARGGTKNGTKRKR